MPESADQTAKPKVGQLIEGPIEDLAYGGAGVLRASGWVVMVRGAFPGDRVRVRLTRRRKGLLEGKLEELLARSPERVPLQCPHVSLCGGCALQGLDPAAQTRYKAHQAGELLRRIGKVVPEETAAPWRSPEAYFYRNKMEFTFGARPWVSRAVLDSGAPFPAGPALGLHPRGVFQGVFDVEDCRLQSPVSNEIVAQVRAIARRRSLPIYNSHRDEGLLRHLVIRQARSCSDLLVMIVARTEDPRLAELAADLASAIPQVTGVVAAINLRRATVAQGDYERPLLGTPHWRERICGLTFRIGASSFFQTQTRGGEALIEEVLAVGDFRSHERVLDLYCGIGTFSLPIAQRAREVLGVEMSESAVREAAHNARENGVGNAAFLAGPVESNERQPWEEPGSWDAVLLDPPRSGLHPKALAKLIGLAPPRIIYVSCNPSTLARDAGVLVQEAGYRARRLRVFDLFPQTPHLESVLLLERASP